MKAISSSSHWMFVAGACFVLASCTQNASTSNGSQRAASQAPALAQTSSTSGGWIANGASACGTYLTPAVVAEILKEPAGQSKTLSPQACSYETRDFSSISITLTWGGTTGLDAHMKYLTDPVPLAGVGDKAVRTMIGIEAAKGADRMCSIDVMPPFAARTSGEALAQQLGAICNRLFALP